MLDPRHETPDLPMDGAAFLRIKAGSIGTGWQGSTPAAGA
jgi:hypothetical protein